MLINYWELHGLVHLYSIFIFIENALYICVIGYDRYHCVGYLVTICYILYCFSERVGAEVVECACVIELPDLKVCSFLTFELFFNVNATLRLFLSIVDIKLSND